MPEFDDILTAVLAFVTANAGIMALFAAGAVVGIIAYLAKRLARGGR